MAYSQGETTAREALKRGVAYPATMTELKAIPAENRRTGMLALVAADGSAWRFSATCALTGEDILVATPAAGSGGWLRMCGAALLVLPFSSASADAAVLLTIPTGCILDNVEPFWTTSVNASGGSTPKIGLSSSNKTSLTTKGDLLGGATGDGTGSLATTASPSMGTIGAGWDTLAKRRTGNLWVAGETIRYDEITSAFTAGTHAANISCRILKNDGA